MQVRYLVLIWLCQFAFGLKQLIHLYEVTLNKKHSSAPQASKPLSHSWCNKAFIDDSQSTLVSAPQSSQHTSALYYCVGNELLWSLIYYLHQCFWNAPGLLWEKLKGGGGCSWSAVTSQWKPCVCVRVCVYCMCSNYGCLMFLFFFFF